MDHDESQIPEDFHLRSLEINDSNKSHNPTILPTYAVLGFLDEYLGRRIEASDEIIERFHCNELATADKFEQYLQKLQNELGLTTQFTRYVDPQGHIYFVSRELTTIINSYYMENLVIAPPKKRTTFRAFLYESNELPYKVFMPGSRWRMGTEEFNQRFSFLVGAYQRYGIENAYSFPNNTGKAELVRTLLGDIGCDWVSIKLWMNCVPYVCQVEFRPTVDLCTFLGLTVNSEEARSKRRS